MSSPEKMTIDIPNAASLPVESDIPIVTIDTVDNRSHEVIGPVWASCCTSRSLVVDLLAHIKKATVGGELKGYSQLLDQAVKIAVALLEKKALSMGAQAVVCLRMVASEVAEGAAEITTYGTAVRFPATKATGRRK